MGAELKITFDVASVNDAHAIVSKLKEDHSVVSAELIVDMLAPSRSREKENTSQDQAPQQSTAPQQGNTQRQTGAPQQGNASQTGRSQAQQRQTKQPEQAPPQTPQTPSQSPEAKSKPEGEEPTFGNGKKVFKKGNTEKQVAVLKPSELVDGWVGTDGVSGRQWMEEMLPKFRATVNDPRAEAFWEKYRTLIPWVETALAE